MKAINFYFDKSNRSLNELIDIPGRIAHSLTNTDVGKKALLLSAGVFAARAAGKKLQQKEDENQSQSVETNTIPKKETNNKIDWLKRGRFKYE